MPLASNVWWSQREVGVSLLGYHSMDRASPAAEFQSADLYGRVVKLIDAYDESQEFFQKSFGKEVELVISVVSDHNGTE